MTNPTTAWVNCVESKTETARITKIPGTESLGPALPEVGPPQRTAIMMLPNFNESKRARHTFPDDLRFDDQNSENNDPRTGIKRKARSPPRISPPPFKRFDRTFSSGQNSGSQTPQEYDAVLGQKSGPKAALSIDDLLNPPIQLSRVTTSPLPTDIRSIGHNTEAAGKHIVYSAVNKSGKQHPQRRPSSSSFTLDHTPVGREEDEISIASSYTRSSASTSASTKCYYCSKSLSTSYDSLAKCSTCSRHFHDGCRKPSLTKDENRATWRCYHCVFQKRKPLVPEDFSTSWKNSPRSTPAGSDKASYQTPTECERHTQKKPVCATFKRTDPSKSGTQAPPIHNSGPRQKRADPGLRSSANRSPTRRIAPKTTGNCDAVIDRSEILATPTQRSSQLPFQSTAASTAKTFDSPISQPWQNYSPVIIDEPQPISLSASTRLCTRCLTKRVFGQNGVKPPICHECKNKIASLNNDGSILTVPETPESATTTHQDKETIDNISESAEAISMTSEAGRAGFWSNSALATNKIKQRKIQKRVPLPLEKNTGQKPSPVEAPAKSQMTCRADPNMNERTAKPVANPTVEENPEARSKAFENYATSLAIRESRMDKAPATATDPINPPLHLPLLDRDSSIASGDVLQRPNAEPSPIKLSRSTTTQSRYSTRELIGIALIAAKDSPLTGREIVEWVQSLLPKTYQIGRGSWSTNIHPVLCQHNDFRKVEVPGDKLKRWTFANAKVRETYMSKFEKLGIERTSPTDPAAFPSLVVKLKVLPKAVANSRASTTATNENAQRSPTLSNMGTGSSSEKTSSEEPDVDRGLRASLGPPCKNTQVQRIDPEETWADDLDAVFMPFEPNRSKAMEVQSDSRVESNFFKAFPEFADPSVEAMTEEARKAKIMEIKKRPSRKGIFGSLLASARNRRDDIHNELEGCGSQSRSVFSEEALPTRLKRRINADDNAEVGEEVLGAQSFRVFSELPDEYIPMLHEGQLAFRDGTLVNGRLPRPRIVYKIGKKL